MKKSTTIEDDPLYLLEGRIQFLDYEKLCNQIDKNGFIPVRDEAGKLIKIYSRWIICIILPEKVGVIKIETATEEFVNGFDYLKDYIKGYFEGIEYFKREFGISPDSFYKSDKYIPDLQENYFISRQKEYGESRGWESIKDSVNPLVFNHASIKNFGYKSGIVRGVEELKEKYPVSFKDFEKLDTDSEILDRPKISMRRVRSFILAEAYNRGEFKIKDCTEKEFNKIIKEKFNNDKPRSTYQTVRSTYKGEMNYLNFLANMKVRYSREYEYAMKIFKDYYPDLREIKSK